MQLIFLIDIIGYLAYPVGRHPSVTILGCGQRNPGAEGHIDGQEATEGEGA